MNEWAVDDTRLSRLLLPAACCCLRPAATCGLLLRRLRTRARTVRMRPRASRILCPVAVVFVVVGFVGDGASRHRRLCAAARAVRGANARVPAAAGQARPRRRRRRRRRRRQRRQKQQEAAERRVRGGAGAVRRGKAAGHPAAALRLPQVQARHAAAVRRRARGGVCTQGHQQRRRGRRRRRRQDEEEFRRRR